MSDREFAAGTEPEAPAMAPRRRFGSLRTLQLAWGLALLSLVAIAGVAGAAGLALNARWAEEARRIDALRQSAAGVRGDLHRQTKEIFDHHFLADPGAEEQYHAWGAAIEGNMAALATLASGEAERRAVASLERALAEIRVVSEAIMARPFGTIAAGERFALLDTELEHDRLTAVEEALEHAESMFFGAERALEARVADRTRLAFVVLMAPIGMAALLLFAARGFLRRGFVRPLAGVLDAVAAYGEGRFERRENEAGVAEMIALQRAVNRMAADLARYRAALVRSEKQAALGALVPVIAHNIRNPLAGIRATAQLFDGPAARGILSAVDRLNEWLEALLTYLDPQKARRAEAALAECADHALTLLAPKLDEKNVTAARRNWKDGGTSLIDSRLTEQALYGLLANAVEASPRGGEIALSVGHDPRACWIAIEDDGPGLLFSPSPRGPVPGPSTKTYGSGLGIPFAYKICELHDGALEFGAAPGGGARVVLSMPAARAGGNPA